MEDTKNTAATTKIDPERKRKLIRKMLRLLEEFKKLDSEMPLQQIVTLVEVALANEEGISVSDLAVRVGNSTSSTSRNVAILGEYGRGKSAGLEVVKAVVNPMDRRYQLVKLTPKGQRVIDQLVEVLMKEV